MRPFCHEASFYAGDSGFLAIVEPFVRDGIDAGEAIPVADDGSREAQLRQRLGPAASGVQFVDLDRLGANPARLIPVWRSFLDGLAPKAPCRGIAESVHADRSRAETEECLVHEALVNLAFSRREPLWLRCLCDSSSVPPETLQDLRRRHPHVSEASGSSPNEDYVQPDAAASTGQRGLPPSPSGTRAFAVEAESVVVARHRVSALAHALGLDPARASDFTLAAHEVIANSVLHGGGRAEVSVWAEEGEVLCEVSDQGRFADALAGRRRPAPDGSSGRGLWIANQLCDLVQIRSSPGGTVVRLHLRLP